MQLCGERGFTNAKGEPCGYRIGAGARGCPHHKGDGTEAREFQRKGALMSKMRYALPPDYEIPDLDSPDGMKQALQLHMELALKKNIERWRVSEFRGALGLRVQIEAVKAQQQTNDMLMRLEHGGLATGMMLRAQEGIENGPRRPVPGKVVSIVEQEAEPA